MLNKQKNHLSEQEKSVVSGLLKKDKEFMCCANCGSIDLTFPPTNVDALIGAGSLPRRYYCRECEYEGLPLLFDNLPAYEKFYKLRREKYNNGEDLLVADRLLSGNFGSEPVKKPYVAALLSLLIPGLGQAYNGQKKKADLFFWLVCSNLPFCRCFRTADAQSNEPSAHSIQSVAAGGYFILRCIYRCENQKIIL